MLEFINKWGHSSAGRALRWQRRGQGFDPPWLHHYLCFYKSIDKWRIKFISQSKTILFCHGKGSWFKILLIYYFEMNEGVLDRLFSLEFLGTWLITLLIIVFIVYAFYKIFNIIFRSEIYFKKSAISYFLIAIFIFGFAIYFYNWLLKF